MTTKILKNIGVFPIRNHYYEPLFDDSMLRLPLEQTRHLPGVVLNEQAQLAFLSNLSSAGELKELALWAPTTANNFFDINNSVFGPGDADFLYQFIRHTRPAKIIEIGSGQSTRIASLAMAMNALEGVSGNHVCIEPYEASWLDSFKGITLVRTPVEQCELDWATELSAGDLLFIDSSHMIRPQGDVLEEYLKIIPSLASGVYVHVHDIFTPRDYPSRWIKDHVFFWNEQYLLEALLSNQARYQVIAGLNFLYHNHKEELQRVCPYLGEIEPGSFYFMVK